MELVLSVDVEEDGLFRGRYPRQVWGLQNLTGLDRLAALCRDFALRPTLLCTHAVGIDPDATAIVTGLRRSLGAELGAHLHPWSTPPFDESGAREPIHPEALAPGLLSAKLEMLLSTLSRAFGAPPASFRMGRFEIGPRALALLPRFGITTDASVVPLRVVPGRVDHFLASAEPFAIAPVEGTSARGNESSTLCEVPLTQQPLARGLPALAWRVSRRLPSTLAERWLVAVRYLGVVGLAPAWFSLAAMKHAATLHRQRGGRVLHLFLHSSDLFPGGSPAAATPARVDHLLRRLRAFLEWLRARGAVATRTLSEVEVVPGSRARGRSAAGPRPS